MFNIQITHTHTNTNTAQSSTCVCSVCFYSLVQRYLTWWSCCISVIFIIAEFGLGSQHLLQIDGHWNMQIIRSKTTLIWDSCGAWAEIAKGPPSETPFAEFNRGHRLTIFRGWGKLWLTSQDRVHSFWRTKGAIKPC